MLINCPHCGKQLDAGPEKLGQVGTCPHCQGRFHVPMPTAEIASQHSTASDPGFDPLMRESILFDPRPVVTQRAYERAPDQGKIHVITERTSKRYKAMQLLGILLFIFGLVLGANTRGHLDSEYDSHLASLITFCGIVLFVIGRVQAWWHHA